MKRRVCAIAILLVAQPTFAAECADVPSSLETATNAVSAWEKVSFTTVAPGVKKLLLTEFCDSVQSVSAKYSTAKINDAAEKAIPMLLDRDSDPNKPSISLSSALRSELGVPGLSQPMPKRWARLAMEYVSAPDTLSIDGERVSPAPLLLVSVGQVAIEGFKSTSRVCQLKVQVPTGGTKAKC